MQVAPGGHQHAVAVGDPLVLGLTAAVGVRLVVRIGVAPPAPGALLDVEDRVRAALLHVHPDRGDRPDAARPPRGARDEVDLVDHVHLGRHRREVVDHVVEQPRVRGAVLVGVALREADDGLLLAGGHEQLGQARRGGIGTAEVGPHAVVQVDHVHARHPAARVDQVGPDAGDPAVHLRLLADDLVADLVLARDHVERTDPVGQALCAVRPGDTSTAVPTASGAALAGAALSRQTATTDVSAHPARRIARGMQTILAANLRALCKFMRWPRPLPARAAAP